MCAWLSALGQSHATIVANGYESKAVLRITAPDVVYQAPVAQVMTTGSQGRAEDHSSSWSVISGTNTCGISTPL
jgi:hypothetical protein